MYNTTCLPKLEALLYKTECTTTNQTSLHHFFFLLYFQCPSRTLATTVVTWIFFTAVGNKVFMLTPYQTSKFFNHDVFVFVQLPTVNATKCSVNFMLISSPSCKNDSVTRFSMVCNSSELIAKRTVSSAYLMLLIVSSS